jgi:hypothetical protein
VGQSTTHGGGIYYNGDNNPAFANNTTADTISLYRVNAGVAEWTARNLYASNDWEFRGNITATTFIGNLTGNVTGNASTVTNGVYTTSAQALHATDALRISGNTLSLYKGDGSSESAIIPEYTLPVATDTVLGGVKGGTDITVDVAGELSIVDNSHNHTSANISDATSANTANTVVKRDASGDFNAGNVNAETAVNLGSTQEATIQYNATENSIDFIIN